MENEDEYLVGFMEDLMIEAFLEHAKYIEAEPEEVVKASLTILSGMIGTFFNNDESVKRIMDSLEQQIEIHREVGLGHSGED